jgi:hypothetical protein
VLAAGVLAVAGCGGSQTKAVSLDFTSPTTTTISNVKTGELVHCRKIEARVPVPRHSVVTNSPSSPGQLQLTRLRNGSLLVSCRSGSS